MWLARGTVLLTAIALASAGAAQAAPPRVTFIADSVADVLLFNPGPFQTLAQGLDLQVLAQPCRKLVDPGCPAENSDHPPSALDTIKQVGTQLGPEVAIEVGYNDFYDSYATGLDQVMNALVAAGVRHVVWVTLVENEGTWAQINQLIRAAPSRWPQVTVADWAPVAAGKSSWFVDDAHMNYEGAVAFAEFLHPYPDRRLRSTLRAASAPTPSHAALLRARPHRERVRPGAGGQGSLVPEGARCGASESSTAVPARGRARAPSTPTTSSIAGPRAPSSRHSSARRSRRCDTAAW